MVICLRNYLLRRGVVGVARHCRSLGKIFTDTFSPSHPYGRGCLQAHVLLDALVHIHYGPLVEIMVTSIGVSTAGLVHTILALDNLPLLYKLTGVF